METSEPAQPGLERPRAGRLDLFKFVVEPSAPLYRAIVRAFVAAKQRYQLRLRPAEVLDLLPPDGELVESENHDDRSHPGDPEALERSLDQLVSWGNLRRTQDTSRARSLEEFVRRRSLYQLTAEGEAAHHAVERVERALGQSGALQRFMLSAVLEELHSLHQEATKADPDAGRLHSTLIGLFEKFDSLANNAGVFMANLDRAIAEGDLADSFLAYKQAVVAYLDRFVSDLRALGGRVRDAVLTIERVGVGDLIHKAATADEAPFSDSNPRIEDWTERWKGIVAWFVGGTHDPPTLEAFRGAGIDAVGRLLALADRANDESFRRINREADLMQLARFFEACEQPTADWLFAEAFGLYSARHMSAPHADEEAVSGASWWRAPPVEVPARLRSSGRGGRTGRVGAIERHAEAKRVLAERMRSERLQLVAVLARFSQRGPVRLSELGRLDAGEFALLLSLLGRALSSPASAGGARRARTMDGLAEVLLTPVEGRAVIVTPHGRLTTADHTLEVRSLMRQPAARPT